MRELLKVAEEKIQTSGNENTNTGSSSHNLQIGINSLNCWPNLNTYNG